MNLLLSSLYVSESSLLRLELVELTSMSIRIAALKLLVFMISVDSAGKRYFRIEVGDLLYEIELITDI